MVPRSAFKGDMSLSMTFDANSSRSTDQREHYTTNIWLFVSRRRKHPRRKLVIHQSSVRDIFQSPNSFSERWRLRSQRSLLRGWCSDASFVAMVVVTVMLAFVGAVMCSASPVHAAPDAFPASSGPCPCPALATGRAVYPGVPSGGVVSNAANARRARALLIVTMGAGALHAHTAAARGGATFVHVAVTATNVSARASPRVGAMYAFGIRACAGIVVNTQLEMLSVLGPDLPLTGAFACQRGHGSATLTPLKVRTRQPVRNNYVHVCV
jgi:hypothetical protein